ncbi:hypothetical protein [Mesorhizobium sp. L103C131B0]|uniref:hypothetical protein n=1 Tax=Mesorhizobium sp. L103C131B0 TaxID=1287089 RepID=UPI0003F7192F|nr:hypothetical protein [Mesorhizobium sp. L103C131B0]
MTAALHKEGGAVVVPIKKPVVAPDSPDALTDAERRAVASFDAREKKRTPLPSFKVKMGASVEGVPHAQVSIDHADVMAGYILQSEAIKSESFAFYDGITQALATLATKGGVTQPKALNFGMAIVAGINPRDQLETMLATQMAAVHMATLTFARRLQGSETIEQQDSNGRTFNKLARTFASQVEALKRYRSKGEQRVIVERVTVERGGQAIVGNVAHGGGEVQENGR